MVEIKVDLYGKRTENGGVGIVWNNGDRVKAQGGIAIVDVLQSKEAGEVSLYAEG